MKKSFYCLLAFPFLLCACGGNTSEKPTEMPSEEPSIVKVEYKITFETKSEESLRPLMYEEGATVPYSSLKKLNDRDSDEYPECRFVCWTLEGEDILADFTMPSHDITLVAKWRALKEWTVHYETGVEGYSLDDTYITEDEGLSSFEARTFEDEYNVFEGWFYDPEFSEEMVNNELDEDKFDNYELTLYAKTSKGSTTVKFDAGEGTVTTESLSVPFGDQIGTLPVATRTGFDFDGWQCEDGRIINSSYVPGSLKELSLNAVWSEADSAYDVWTGNASTSLLGTGTEDDPYLINSAADLRFLSNNVNAIDTNYNSAYYKLTTGIDLANRVWAPIGAAKTAPFKGVFDGQNHKIINLNVSASLCYAGLFGYLVDAEVSNLSISGSIVEKENGFMTGFVAGVMFDSTISNCNVVGTVVGYKESIGGIVGVEKNVNADVSTKHTKSTITNCINRATVTLINPNPSINGTAGGIIGGAYAHEIDITNCKNYGLVEGGNGDGGILGKSLEVSKIKVSGCENYGSISGVATDDNNNFAGGIVGMVRQNANSLVTDCRNYGDITTPSTKAAGIVGLLRGTLTNCYCANNVMVSGRLVNESALYRDSMDVVLGAAICWQNDVQHGGVISTCGLFDPLA